MKKETIFKPELNESIAANAAMACLKNRNKHKQLNEAAPLAGAVFAALRPIIINSVRTLGARAGARMATSQLAKNVIGKIGNPETIGKIGKQLGQTWNKIPEEVKDELFNLTFDAAKDFLTKKRRTQEQEEHTLNAYYSEDEDYENDHHGIWLIINLMRKMGMLRAQGIEGRDDVDDGHAINAAYDLIEQKLDEEGMWIGDDDHEAERFVSFFGDEIAQEAMKSAIHNQEQEEMPQMERHDMILALTQYLDECWIDSDEDGDLDDLYYAVAKVLDKTGDYPASTDWEDCKPWCQKHYREVEESFLGGGF